MARTNAEMKGNSEDAAWAIASKGPKAGAATPDFVVARQTQTATRFNKKKTRRKDRSVRPRARAFMKARAPRSAWSGRRRRRRPANDKKSHRLCARSAWAQSSSRSTRAQKLETATACLEAPHSWQCSQMEGNPAAERSATHLCVENAKKDSEAGHGSARVFYVKTRAFVHGVARVLHGFRTGFARVRVRVRVCTASHGHSPHGEKRAKHGQTRPNHGKARASTGKHGHTWPGLA